MNPGNSYKPLARARGGRYAVTAGDIYVIGGSLRCRCSSSSPFRWRRGRQVCAVLLMSAIRTKHRTALCAHARIISCGMRRQIYALNGDGSACHMQRSRPCKDYDPSNAWTLVRGPPTRDVNGSYLQNHIYIAGGEYETRR